ncbi:PREDICTED: glutathione S-transferase A4 isoform X2 [Galeopterus variegatus]|uniref:glutathione transferase n=1 Tax=Galeopterus variegatus TaxID=482537 RepID=A0ABM0SGB2_GALVR|nr:PREDICTED: glutathione S-transferase A4 isoform X2 [Galeopterus variegatus]
MAARPKLHYPNGRGRMESVRWLLAAAGVEFDEEFLETKEQLHKLQDGNHLLFQQVPMVEIDGMKLVQTRSILHYIADKYHLFGKDLKERTLIDMYVEGTLDLLELIIMHPFLKPDDQQKEMVSMAQKAKIRYFPVFEKILRDHGQSFLVGNQLSLADVILLQTILALEEKIPNILSAFPFLQEYSVKISNIPTIKRFLEPGSKKKPPPDEIYIVKVSFGLHSTLPSLPLSLLRDNLNLHQEFDAFTTRISNIPTIRKSRQPGSQRKPPLDGHFVTLVRNIL